MPSQEALPLHCFRRSALLRTCLLAAELDSFGLPEGKMLAAFQPQWGSAVHKAAPSTEDSDDKRETSTPKPPVQAKEPLRAEPSAEPSATADQAHCNLQPWSTVKADETEGLSEEGHQEHLSGARKAARQPLQSMKNEIQVKPADSNDLLETRSQEAAVRPVEIEAAAAKTCLDNKLPRSQAMPTGFQTGPASEGEPSELQYFCRL